MEISCLHLWWKNPNYPLNRRLNGLSDAVVKIRIAVSVPGIEFQLSVLYTITLLTELSGMKLNLINSKRRVSCVPLN